MKRNAENGFKVTDLGNGILRLNEFDFANCYLVIGKEKAALIDAGVGIADLGSAVERLTDKPVILLLTHAHADHLGGAYRFPEARLHPADLRRGKKYARLPARLYFLSCHKYKRVSHGIRYADALHGGRPPRFVTIEEGFTADLGGRAIETYWMPGHSVGSLTFRDTATGALFTGDNVNPMVTLHYPGGTALSTWLAGAARTLALAGDAPILGGHGDAIEKSTSEAAIRYARDCLREPPKKRGVVKKQGTEKYPVLYYRPSRETR